jgi:hypothetical protein
MSSVSNSMLEDPTLRDYIAWSEDGKSFLVYNPISVLYSKQHNGRLCWTTYAQTLQVVLRQ